MTRILYLAPVEWHSIRQRPQHLASRLARHYGVTYVEPVGLRSVKWSDAGRICRRAAAETASPATLPRIQPRYLPLLGNRWLDRANRRWLLGQVKRQFPQDDRDWILWLSTPSLLAEALLETASPKLVVYDCMDRYAAFHRGATRERIDRAEARIVSRADVVFASSQALAERLERFAKVTLIPNGVDFEHFAIGPGHASESMKHRADPTIGFYGTLGDWLDYPLLAELIRRRPDWRFVFAGPRSSQAFGRLPRQPNVHYLGVVDYDELPQCAACFDVGLVPFRLNAVTRYAHPIKVLEYLALGIPVVSTPLADLAELAPVIHFASGADRWLAAIEQALLAESRGEAAVARRRTVAAGHDWNERALSIHRRLSAALGDRSDGAQGTGETALAGKALRAVARSRSALIEAAP